MGPPVRGDREVTMCLPWDAGEGDRPIPSQQEDREQPEPPAPAGGPSWERAELDPEPACASIGGRGNPASLLETLLTASV